VCDLCLLNPAVLVVSGLSEVLGALEQILLSYLVHMTPEVFETRAGACGPNNLGGSTTPLAREGPRLSMELLNRGDWPSCGLPFA
jgi:hypothetical protein